MSLDQTLRMALSAVACPVVVDACLCNPDGKGRQATATVPHGTDPLAALVDRLYSVDPTAPAGEWKVAYVSLFPEAADVPTALARMAHGAVCSGRPIMLFITDGEDALPLRQDLDEDSMAVVIDEFLGGKDGGLEIYADRRRGE